MSCRSINVKLQRSAQKRPMQFRYNTLTHLALKESALIWKQIDSFSET